jgi:hypothetical protein
MIIKAKTARGKDKVLNRGTHSFSVSHGIRVGAVKNVRIADPVLFFDLPKKDFHHLQSLAKIRIL